MNFKPEPPEQSNCQRLICSECHGRPKEHPEQSNIRRINCVPAVTTVPWEKQTRSSK